MLTDADTILADTHASAPAEPAAQPELSRGAVVGRYCVLERVGAGAMGVVYAAYDPKLDRKVALKVVRSTRGGAPVSDILAEAQALAQLNHPNVVSVYDVGEHDGGVFMAMEFVLGVSLRAWGEAHERSRTEILHTFREAATGLAAAHNQGIVHRDFKPENAMVAGGGRVIVMDFGLARRRAEEDADAVEDGTEATQSAGTPAYMSPEQYRGLRVDARSDQYSFCVALYEALSGKRPFRADTLADLANAVTKGHWADERPLAKVPRWLRTVVLRGLQRSPDDRHPTMDALIAAIDRGVHRPRRLAIAGLCVLATGGLAAGVWLSEADARACQREAAQMSETWLPQQREQLAAGFAALPRDAEDTTRRTTERVDAFAQGWEQARSTTCAAWHTMGTLSESEYEARTQCLHRQRTFVEGLLAGLQDADPDALWAIAAASSELPIPARCEDARVDRGPDGGFDPEAQETIRRGAEALAQAEAMVARNDRAEARETLQTWLEDLDDVPAPLLRSEMLRTLAKIHYSLGDPEAGDRDARRAVLEAARSGDPTAIADAWLMRVEQVAELDPAHAKTLLEAATAAVVALGDAPDQQCSLDVTRARVALRSGEAVEIAELLESAEAHLRHGTTTVAVQSAIESLRSAAAFELEDYETAAEYNRRRQALLAEAYGPSHPDLAGAELNLGFICLKQRDEACGRRHFERTVELATPGDAIASTARLSLGQLAYDEGDLAAAKQYAEQVLVDRRTRADGPTSRLVAPLQLLADVALRQDDAQAALEYADEIAEVAAATTDPGHPHRGLAQSTRGRALLALGRVDDAIEAHERALELRRAKLPARPRSVGITLVELARCHQTKGQHDRAAARAAEAIEMLREPDPNGTWIAEAQFVRAAAIVQDDLAQARRLAEQARRGLASHTDSKADLLAEIDAWLTAHPGDATQP